MKAHRRSPLELALGIATGTIGLWVGAPAIYAYAYESFVPLIIPVIVGSLMAFGIRQIKKVDNDDIPPGPP
jgi:Na+-transporting methylmalonyl-CoA/oxaloacetate decarboxylase beta subunit